jgi:hypothetical protein
VSGPDFGEQVVQAPHSGDVGTSRAPRLTVPLGDDRVITVEAVGRTGAVVARGRSLSLDVTETGQHLFLYLGLLGQFSAAAPPAVGVGQAFLRGGHQARLLEDGQVLLVGGGRTLTYVVAEDRFAVRDLAREAALFDATGGRLSVSAACVDEQQPLCLRHQRIDGGGGPLGAGSFLLAGGRDGAGNPLVEAERYVPEDQRFNPVELTQGERMSPMWLPRETGGGLIGGEAEGGEVLRSAVFLGPSTTEVEDLLACSRQGGHLVAGDGFALIYGGYRAAGAPLESHDLLSWPAQQPDAVPQNAGPGYCLTAGDDTSSTAAPLSGAAAAVVSLEGEGGKLDRSYVILTGGVGADATSADIVLYAPFLGGHFCLVGRLASPRRLHRTVFLPESRHLLVVGGLERPSDMALESEGWPRPEYLDLQPLIAALEPYHNQYLQNSDQGGDGAVELSCDDFGPDLVLADGGPADSFGLPQGRLWPALLPLGNGTVLVSGGFGQDGEALAEQLMFVVP